MILTAFAKALSQMTDPRFRWVLMQGVGLTFLLLFGLFATAFWGIAWLVPDSISLPWLGEVGISNALISWGSLGLMMIASVFLMVPVASAFTGLFLDEVADAVEARHYPQLGAAPNVGLMDNLRESLVFLGVIVVSNLAALILYFTPLAPFVFYGLNGFLLGREYYRMIAVRRMGRQAAGKSFRSNFLTIWSAGVLMAVPLTLPVINLLIPILGAATFTHVFHGLNRSVETAGGRA
ncbi:MAG: EI24 domain-containing protein [Pseudomonadota bacterium]